MLCSPAGAVSGYQEVGGQFGERVDGGADARGEEGAAQVQAAEQGVQLGDAGQPLGVADDVDGARIGAPEAVQDAGRFPGSKRPLWPPGLIAPACRAAGRA